MHQPDWLPVEWSYPLWVRGLKLEQRCSNWQLVVLSCERMISCYLSLTCSNKLLLWWMVGLDSFRILPGLHLWPACSGPSPTPA